MNVRRALSLIRARYDGEDSPLALSHSQAVILAVALAEERPLDVLGNSTDAALLHRADELVQAGAPVRQALNQARLATRPDPTLVLLERHTIGPHAIELWGPAPPPTPPQPEPSYRGNRIGTCTRCRAGVGQEEWTFGAWDGRRWRYSGHTLRGASQLATLTALLCCDCAVRAKYGLITPPTPTPRIGSRADEQLASLFEADEEQNGQ
jgi:hypothetical protein